MTEYKRLFPDQYEARYGKNSEYRLRKDRENYVDKLMDEQREKMVNDFFNYVPKNEKQNGLFETDPFKSSLFDDDKNEKKKKDEDPLKGRSF